MQSVNRTRFNLAFMQKLRKDMREKNHNAFIEKYNPRLKNGNVIIDGKQVIPEKSVERILDKVTRKSAAPLGIRSLQDYIQQRYIGITRSTIKNYLQSDPTLGEIRQRPAGGGVGRRTEKNHGITKWVVDKWPNTIGADCIKIAGSWDAPIQYILMAVHLRTGYPWAFQLKKKKPCKKDSSKMCFVLDSAEVKKKLTSVIADCTKRFGFPNRIQTDRGGEFKSLVEKLLNRKGIRKVLVDKENTVERKNSVFQRYLIFTKQHMSWNKAFDSALRKLRNIRSTVTGRKPAEVTRYEKIERTYRKDKNWEKDKPSFKVGDMVKYVKRGARNDVLHKSYEISNAKRTWSKPFEIKKKHSDKYFVDGEWRKYHDLVKSVKRNLKYTERKPKPVSPKPERRKLPKRKRKRPDYLINNK